MINRQMQECKILENVRIQDDYGAWQQSFEQVDTIDMAINLKSFNAYNNDVRFTNVTHIGLTHCKSLRIGQKVIDSLGVEYKVDFVNNYGRLAQIYLIEVVTHV